MQQNTILVFAGNTEVRYTKWYGLSVGGNLMVEDYNEALCHPERRNHAHNLCQACYRQWRRLEARWAKDEPRLEAFRRVASEGTPHGP